jgi:hypothetical protein
LKVSLDRGIIFALYLDINTGFTFAYPAENRNQATLSVLAYIKAYGKPQVIVHVNPNPDPNANSIPNPIPNTHPNSYPNPNPNPKHNLSLTVTLTLTLTVTNPYVNPYPKPYRIETFAPFLVLLNNEKFLRENGFFFFI